MCGNQPVMDTEGGRDGHLRKELKLTSEKKNWTHFWKNPESESVFQVETKNFSDLKKDWLRIPSGEKKWIKYTRKHITWQFLDIKYQGKKPNRQREREREGLLTEEWPFNHQEGFHQKQLSFFSKHWGCRATKLGIREVQTKRNDHKPALTEEL